MSRRNPPSRPESEVRVPAPSRFRGLWFHLVEPHRSAERVFWIMDNGSSHRGARCLERLNRRWPRIIAVHTPVHASWLNRVEVYFSIIQRKVLTPCDFRSLADLEDRLLGFQEHYGAIARPFEWKFTRRDLNGLLSKLAARELHRLARAA